MGRPMVRQTAKWKAAFTLLLCAPLLIARYQEPPKNIVRSHSGTHVSKIGTVTQVDSRIVHATTDGQSLVLTLAPNATVWKGRDYHDFSAIRVGDEVMVTGEVDKDGNIAVSKLWDSIVHLAGSIVRVNGPLIEIETAPTETHPAEKVAIEMDENTRFVDSDKADLEAGREIDVVAVRMSKGQVQASKITVYIGNRPARPGSHLPVLPPTR
jgi:hypothetical protein